jgi:RNA polymerase sigma factor (sigma-70 family)
MQPLPPATEVVLLLAEVDMRRICRKVLRRQFGLDMVRHRRARWADEPRTMEAAHAYIRYVQGYALATAVVVCGLEALVDALQTPGEGPALFQAMRAAMRAAMRTALETRLPLVLATAMSAQSPVHQTAATVDMAGWGRTQVHLYESVRGALEQDGDPETVLRERLPGITYEAWRAVLSQGVPGRFLTDIRRQVHALRREVHPWPAPADVPAPATPEEVLLRAEARVQLNRALSTRGLSPQQTEMLLLREIEGLTQEETARRLGLSRSTVNAQEARAWKKPSPGLPRRGSSPVPGMRASRKPAAWCKWTLTASRMPQRSATG